MSDDDAAGYPEAPEDPTAAGNAGDPEPDVNISGGEAGGGTAAEFGSGDPATRAEAVVDRLGDIYWEKTYGGQQAFESLVRTVLSQNTSDEASQPAHDALMERYGPADELAENLAAADREELAETIRPAGLYNRKSRTLQRLAERVTAEYGGSPDDRSDASGAGLREDNEAEPLTPAEGFDTYVREHEPAEVRTELLDMNGVGPKTADCVLLFAGGREGVFPVDTHVHRIYRRLGVAPPDADHEGVRAVLEADVPPEKCGFGHTASIQFGREYCTARTPACLDGPDACPMYDLCDRVGVDPEAGEVVDPADAVDEA